MKGFYALEDPSFEEFQQRGVYLAQCRTFTVAKNLARNFNNVISSTDIMKACRQAPNNLRIVREYRDANSQAFRDLVANEMRSIRANRTSH